MLGKLLKKSNPLQITNYYFKIVIWLHYWLLHLKSNQITNYFQGYFSSYQTYKIHYKVKLSSFSNLILTKKLQLSKWHLERSLAFFHDNSEKNFKCFVICDHTDKSNTSFETVKGLLLFVCTHNINKTLWFCKIKKTNIGCAISLRISFWNVWLNERKLNDT